MELAQVAYEKFMGKTADGEGSRSQSCLDTNKAALAQSISTF